jgi:DNA repair photolyase
MQNSFFEEPVKPYSGTIIYETRGKAREYRELSANLYAGCSHNCIYCYAPDVVQRNRREFHENVTIRKDILAKLTKDAAGYRRARELRQILFCFTCDPYYPEENEHQTTREALKIIKANNLSFCVLTKGGSRAMRDLDLYTLSDTFATTLTSLDENVCREWEPNAASPMDRCVTLQSYHRAGIPTWVSLEPVIDPQMTFDIIRETHEYVDEFKVGVLNYHPRAKEINWREFGLQAVDLLESLGAKYYLKEDLRKHLA